MKPFKSYSFYFLSFLLLSFSTPSFSAQICYFSLNNEKEFKEMEELVYKLNSSSEETIQIQEFLTEGGNPEEDFKKMIETKVQCDGLVISGHHTGSFGGKRAQGNLSLNFLEELSCEPEAQEFFSNIKALWLQGCRTMGVGTIEAYEDPDYHTERVGAVLTEDHLEQSFSNLNIEFSATLDQDNPLSSRYLRVFPKATTFGWTKTAPGEKARSELSIPFHITHIAHLNDEKRRFFDPLVKTISDENKIYFLKALHSLLKNDMSFQNEELLIKAWLAHGDMELPYSFDNPDLNAYPSLLKSKDSSVLLRAKDLGCMLGRSKDFNELKEVLSEILEKEALLGYTYNSIYSLFLSYKNKEEKEEFEDLKLFLQDSPVFETFIAKKLLSKELGIIRKIDYYVFWKDVFDAGNEIVEESIKEIFKKIILEPHTPEDYDMRDYKEMLLKKLMRYNLIGFDTLKELTNSPKINADVLANMAWVIGYSKHPIPNASQILKDILNSPKANVRVLYMVAEAVKASKHPIPDASQILNTILNHSKANDNVLSSVAEVIGDSKYLIPDASQILNTILNHSKANDNVLLSVALNIGQSKYPIPNTSQILKVILNSLTEDAYVLSSVANAIGDSKHLIPNASQILKDILNSPKANVRTLLRVATAIGNSEYPIPDASQILKDILNSPIADAYVLENVARAIGDSKHLIPDASQILNTILNHSKADAYVLKSVAWAIGHSKHLIPDASQILKDILNSPIANAYVLTGVAWAIGHSKHLIPDASQILNTILNHSKANDSVIIKVKELKVIFP